MAVSITGWGHNKFGTNLNLSSEEMIKDVVEQAINHSEIEARDIDTIVVGTFNNGFQKQDFHAALPAISQEYLKHVPSSRV